MELPEKAILRISAIIFWVYLCYVIGTHFPYLQGLCLFLMVAGILGWMYWIMKFGM